jgi:uncharacterized integral membrane protein
MWGVSFEQDLGIAILLAVIVGTIILAATIKKR